MRILAVAPLLLLGGCDVTHIPLTQHQIEIVNSCPKGWYTTWSEDLTDAKINITCQTFGVE